MSLSLKAASNCRRRILLVAALLLFAQSVVAAHSHGSDVLGPDCVVCTTGHAQTAACDQAPVAVSVARPCHAPAPARTVLPVADGHAPFRARAPPNH